MFSRVESSYEDLEKYSNLPGFMNNLRFPGCDFIHQLRMEDERDRIKN